MSLIKCPECGNDVSDKAMSCPHCGYQISIFVNNQPRLCTECGHQIEPSAEICPFCGMRTNTEVNNYINPYNSELKEKRKKSIFIALIIILSVIIVAIAVSVAVMCLNRTTKLSGTYNISKDGISMTLTFNDDGTIEGNITSPIIDNTILGLLGEYTSIDISASGTWRYNRQNDSFILIINGKFTILGIETSETLVDEEEVFCDKNGVLTIGGDKYYRIYEE